MKIQVVALVCLSSALFGVSEGWAAMGKPHERLKNTPLKTQCDLAKEAASRAQAAWNRCQLAYGTELTAVHAQSGNGRGSSTRYVRTATLKCASLEEDMRTAVANAKNVCTVPNN